MTRLQLDFETYSECDLKTHGLDRYVRHPSTEALMLAYAFDDEPVQIVTFAEGEKAPARLKAALRDPTVILSAWNAQFERAIFKHVLGLDLPPERFRDTMVVAMTLSLPASLGAAGEVVNLPKDKAKDARGKALIRMFSIQRKPTKTKTHTRCTKETDPEAWEEFKSYCMQDVEAERAIWRRLRKWDLPEHEWSLWHLDQKINEAGIPINRKMVDNAVRVSERVVTAKLAELKQLTGLSNPNSPMQLLPWLRERGYQFEDLKKGHVQRALDTLQEDERGGELMQVLELRQEVSKSSVKKYQAIQDRVGPDGNLRNTFQFAGAGRTWRWAGRGAQFQNPPRPAPYLEKTQLECARHLEALDPESIEIVYHKPMDLLATCVRPSVQPPPGFLLADADLSAIENRVLGWVADEQKILDVFRQGRDPYLDFATYMTGRSYEDLEHEFRVLKNKKNRTNAKAPVLGAGYRLGPGEAHENPVTGEIEATGLLGYAWAIGIKITQEEATEAVRIWRETYTKVVDYWYSIEDAAKRCVLTGRPQIAGFAEFDRSGPFLRMRLPSGRSIHYVRPEIRSLKTPWGAMRDNVTYEGLNNQNQWVRLSTQGGKLVENLVQAVARDLLTHGMMLADRNGLDIRMTIHDQIVCVAPEAHAEEHLRILQECMSDAPEWARDLPLASEGFVSSAFIKD